MERPEPVPTVFDAISRLGGAAERAQEGLLQLGRTGRDADGGSAARNADRHDQRNRSRRQRKSNARRTRMEMQQAQVFETLRAQIRVASGQTSASPALVENARKALQAKVDRVLTANPGMTEEQAAEIVYTAAAGVR